MRSVLDSHSLQEAEGGEDGGLDTSCREGTQEEEEEEQEGEEDEDEDVEGMHALRGT